MLLTQSECDYSCSCHIGCINYVMCLNKVKYYNNDSDYVPEFLPKLRVEHKCPGYPDFLFMEVVAACV